MTDKVITIDVPEGYEIDKDKSTFEKIVFKSLNACKQPLPKKWEELGYVWGAVIRGDSQVGILGWQQDTSEDNKRIWPTEAEAYAALALSQLCQLRDRYNDGWKPDWTNQEDKFVIYCGNGMLCKHVCSTVSDVLAFKTAELRDEFLNNFRDLIEQARPLL